MDSKYLCNNTLSIIYSVGHTLLIIHDLKIKFEFIKLHLGTNGSEHDSTDQTEMAYATSQDNTVLKTALRQGIERRTCTH